jgi:hypothetical protein
MGRDPVVIIDVGIGFVGHLQLVIAIHYGAIANSHILQFNTARNESFRSAVSSSVHW